MDEHAIQMLRGRVGKYAHLLHSKPQLERALPTQSQSITNPRRDLQNGYLVAEMLARFYPVSRIPRDRIPWIWSPGRRRGSWSRVTMDTQVGNEIFA
jgi:hypothetical protein